MASERIQAMIDELKRCGYVVALPTHENCPQRGDVSVVRDFIEMSSRWHCMTCGQSGVTIDAAPRVEMTRDEAEDIWPK